MSAPEQSAPLKKYHGNCHCHAFEFSVMLPELKEVYECNCSICSRRGVLWAFPLKDSDFVIEKGEGTLTEYSFGPKTKSHKFCPTCGTAVYTTATNRPEGQSTAVNARTFSKPHFDIHPEGLYSSIKITSFDGAAMGPAYEFSPAPPHDLQPDEGEKLYHKTCHCGALHAVIAAPPAEDWVATACNCSICTRNGSLWYYSKNPKARFLPSKPEAVTNYTFGTGIAVHKFCAICGVEVVNTFSPELSHPVTGKDTAATNIRGVEGVDVQKLEVTWVNGWDILSSYDD
ncbi:MAG: hypothetical protein M1834_001740 [Cirrosporium novae-zelandiae]|nr:MAG: hypothetical protein M1834_001740 [Cirrosporium novae-zelandiae]